MICTIGLYFNRGCTYDSTAEEHILKKLCLNEEKESDAIYHSNRVRHSAHDDEQQQEAAALQLQQKQDSNTQSSSSRNT